MNYNSFESKLQQIMTFDEIEHFEQFAKQKIISMNVKSNTIIHTNSFFIINQNSTNDMSQRQSVQSFKSTNSFNTKKKNSTMSYFIDSSPIVDLKITRSNYEVIKNNNILTIKKDKLRTLLSEYQIVNNENMMSDLEELIKNIKYDMLIKNNINIMKNVYLINKLKENKLSINFPVFTIIFIMIIPIMFLCLNNCSIL